MIVAKMKQCGGCVYWDRHSACCDYALREGHTRSGLHLDDPAHLNDPCKERKTGRRKRNSKAASILPPRPRRKQKAPQASKQKTEGV